MIVKSTVAPIYCPIWFVRFGRSPMPLSFYLLQARDGLSAWHYHCPALEIRNPGFNTGGCAAQGAEPGPLPRCVCAKLALLTRTPQGLSGGL